MVTEVISLRVQRKRAEKTEMSLPPAFVRLSGERRLERLHVLPQLPAVRTSSSAGSHVHSAVTQGLENAQNCPLSYAFFIVKIKHTEETPPPPPQKITANEFVSSECFYTKSKKLNSRPT